MNLQCGKCGGELNTAGACTRCGEPYLNKVAGTGMVWPVQLTEADVRRIVREELAALRIWPQQAKPYEGNT